MMETATKRLEAALATEIERLIARIQAGDVAAVAEAYEWFHERVRRLARRLLAEDAAAEDVVQEVFEALPRALRWFRREADLETFLLGMTVKRARHHLRGARRRRRALGGLVHTPPLGPRDPEQEAYRRQLADLLTRALDTLTVDHRVAFVLCEVEALSAAEAARIVRIPEATMRTRLFHARRRLRACLEEGRP